MSSLSRSRRSTALQAGLSTKGRDSLVGRLTDQRKLNGQVYTPLPLAARLLEFVAWPAGDAGVLLDPACGDGVFLEAAIRKVLARFGATAQAARIVRTRLLGWELDPQAAAACRSRLRAVLAEVGLSSTDAPPVRVENALLTTPPRGLSCVVGNPPYLEAKRMPDSLKALIRETCPLAAQGSFDLYTAFVERAVEMTASEPAHVNGGEVCLLIPNRFLVVRYAKGLRARILSERDVQVLDLSREKRVFADAAVYPVVLHLRAPKRRQGSPSYRAQVNEEYETCHAGAATNASVNANTSAPEATLATSTLIEWFDSVMPVLPEHPGGRALLARLMTGFCALADTVSVRWCVSFHRAKLREKFVAAEPDPSWRNPQPFLGGGRFYGNAEVQPFRIDWGGSWIDYDEERARAEGNALPPKELFAKPKLVVCQNARRLRAAVDRKGYILKDTFLALISHKARPPRGQLEWLCMVLNSRLLHYLYEHLYAGTRKQGGYLHYLARYLEPLPLPPMPLPPSELVALHRRLEKGTAHPAATSDLLVEQAYAVEPHEAAALAAYDMPAAR